MPIEAPQQNTAERLDAATKLRYGQKEAQIGRTKTDAENLYESTKKALEGYGEAGRGVIGTEYENLFGALDRNRAASKEALGQQVTNVGKGYQTAQLVNEQARKDAADRLARLGGNIGAGSGALVASATPMEALAQRLLEESTAGEASATANMGNWAAMQDAFLGEGKGMSEREKASAVSTFETELLSALADAESRRMQQIYDAENALLDLLTEKGAFATDYGFQLEDSQWNKVLQAAQYNLQEEQARAEAAARSASASAAMAQLAWEREKFEREFPTADAYKRAQTFSLLNPAQKAPEDIYSAAESIGVDPVVINDMLAMKPAGKAEYAAYQRDPGSWFIKQYGAKGMNIFDAQNPNRLMGTLTGQQVRDLAPHITKTING